MTMKKYKLLILLLCFLITLNSCQKFQDGMMGNKRSKSSDEFLVHKKKPLVVPPDFEDMPSPKPIEKKESQVSESSETIEDLLSIKKDEGATYKKNDDNSLEQSILEKIKSN